MLVSPVSSRGEIESDIKKLSEQKSALEVHIKQLEEKALSRKYQLASNETRQNKKPPPRIMKSGVASIPNSSVSVLAHTTPLSPGAEGTASDSKESSFNSVGLQPQNGTAPNAAYSAGGRRGKGKEKEVEPEESWMDGEQSDTAPMNLQELEAGSKV